MDTLRGCFFCGIMLLTTAASGVPRVETILVPVADGAIFDQSPFDGIGDTDGISDDQTVTVGLNSLNLDSRGVIEYDLTHLPRRKPIQSAILRIEVLGRSSLPGTTIAPVQVMGYRGDGTLQVDDFNEGTFVTVYDGFAASNGSVIEVDVTHYVQALKRRRLHYVGFSFRTNVHGFFRTYGSLDTGQHIELVVVQ